MYGLSAKKSGGCREVAFSGGSTVELFNRENNVKGFWKVLTQ